MATSVIKRAVAAVDKFSPSFTSIDDFKAFLANAADIGLVCFAGTSDEASRALIGRTAGVCWMIFGGSADNLNLFGVLPHIGYIYSIRYNKATNEIVRYNRVAMEEYTPT